MKRGKRKAGGASAAAGSGAQRALVDVRGVGQQIVVQFDPGKAANGKKGKKATRPKFWVVDSDVRKQHGLGSGSFTLGAGAAFDPPLKLISHRRPGVRLPACSTLLVPCQAPGAVPTVQKGVFERSPSFFSLTTRAAREGAPVMAGGTDEGTVIRCHIVPSGCTGCCGIQADHVASKLTIFSRRIT